VERDRCKLAGLVLSRRPDDDADFARSNIEQIAARWPGRIVLFEGDERVLDVFHVER
jgi:hypothetical protein